MSKTTIITARAYSMNVSAIVKYLHLTLEEADTWAKKNIIDTSQVISLSHCEKGIEVKKIPNKNYVNPEKIGLGMNCEQYKKEKK